MTDRDESVCIISAFRLVALINGDIASLDLDWNYVQVGIWTATECNMAIVSGTIRIWFLTCS